MVGVGAGVGVFVVDSLLADLDFLLVGLDVTVVDLTLFWFSGALATGAAVVVSVVALAFLPLARLFSATLGVIVGVSPVLLLLGAAFFDLLVFGLGGSLLSVDFFLELLAEPVLVLAVGFVFELFEHADICCTGIMSGGTVG